MCFLIGGVILVRVSTGLELYYTRTFRIGYAYLALLLKVVYTYGLGVWLGGFFGESILERHGGKWRYLVLGALPVLYYIVWFGLAYATTWYMNLATTVLLLGGLGARLFVRSSRAAQEAEPEVTENESI